MAQKKFYRYLILTVMATFFTVLLALNALAAPAGGIGEIIGLEENVTYEAKPVTINAAGTGYTMGDAITLDETGNKNLAGLYVVSSNGFTTWSDLIYVQGALEGRQKLGTIAEGTTINATRDRASATDVFKVGFYYGASYGSESSGSVGAAFQTDYVFSTAYWKGNSSPYGYYDPWPTPTGLQAALDAEATNDETYTGPSSTTIQSQVKAMLESYSLNYAYTSDEIIPVDELLTMKIGLSKRGNYDNFKISPITSKVVFLVMDENGNVTEHTWTGASKTLTFYASTIIEETIDVQSISTLPDKGWIVAFKYYPVGYISADAVTVGSTGRGTGNEGRRIYDFNLRVGYDESVAAMSDYYVIAKPKEAAPTGVTYDAETNTLSGLESGMTYTIASYTVEGVGEAQTITATSTTATVELSAGLWGISVNASDSNAASDPYVFYVEGFYADRANLGTYTDGAINATRDRNGEEWKNGYYFGVNKIGYSTANKFCNAYAFNGSKTTSYFGAEFIPTAKALYEAVTAETNNDTTYTGKSSLEIKTQVKTILENYYVSYAYTSDEIIPVDELLTVKFGRGKIGALTLFVLPEITGKAIFYVMDETGTVTPYTWTGTSKAISTSGAMAYDEINMQTVLPDTGWVVGFKYYPVGTVNAEDITYASSASASTSDRVYEFTIEMGSSYDGFYVIKVPKAETPTGITYDAKTKTLSGLTAGTSYTLTSYTIVGAGATQTVTAESETAVVELTAGLWGINVNAGTDNTASDIYIFYVEGSEEGRANLGTYKDDGVTLDYNKYVTSVTDDIWRLGVYNGADYVVKEAGNVFTNHYAFNSSRAVDIYGAEFAPIASELAAAEAAEAAGETYEGKSSLEIKTQVKTVLENYFISYAYNSDEIIPVDELYTVKFSRRLNSGIQMFKFSPVKGKVEFYVMDETGAVTPYTWTSEAKGIDTTNALWGYDEVDAQAVLPDTGWVVGFKYYPVAEVELDAIDDWSASTQGYIAFMDFQIGSEYDGFYVIKEDPKTEVTGASLLLDGAIGIKLYMSYAENVTAITLANIDEYTKTTPTVTMADGVATAVFYVNPKDALSFSVTGDVVYTVDGTDKTIENAFSLSVPDYVTLLKTKAEAGDEEALSAKALVEALEVYYTQADIYFDSDKEAVAVTLTDAEIADIAGRANPIRTGSMPTGFKFYSTSLVLEETTTIRHYFTTTDEAANGTLQISVGGETVENWGFAEGSSGAFYFYVEVSDIGAGDLGTGTEVIFEDGTGAKCSFTFSALDYVKLTYNDETNAKLMNLARALYKYSAEADAYLNPQA